MIVNYAKLERIIVELIQALPETPDWVMISTTEGHFLRQYPTHLDGDHIASLTHTNFMQSSHLLRDFQSGPFRYSIHVGSNGLYFLILVGEQYLLGLNYQHIKSIDSALTALSALTQPLLAFLNEKP